MAEVFDDLPFLTFYKDKNNRHLRVNRAAAAVRGLSAETMENTSASEWYPDEAEDYYQADLRVIGTGKPMLNITELIELKPGIKRWFNTDKYPTFDSAGEVSGILVFCRLLEDRDPVVVERPVRANGTS